MPLPIPFVVKKGLEDTPAHVGRHARAGIADSEHHEGAGLDRLVPSRVPVVEIDVRRFDGECPAVRHGVAGVHRKVHEDLGNLARIGVHEPESLAHARHEGDVLADDPPKHPAHIDDRVVEVQGLRPQNLLPAEGQQLGGQERGLLGRTADLGDVVAPAITGWQIVHDQIRVARDRGQHVVEVVSDAAGEQPHRLELL